MRARRRIFICAAGALLLFGLAQSARAEMQFPLYDSLSSQDKSACGYKVNQSSIGNTAYLAVEIPSRTAKYCGGARLYVYDENKRMILQSDVGLHPTKDGGLAISAELDKKGIVELIIYSGEVPGVVASKFDFGGFTFRVAKES
jgi:hypothetical protein